MTNARGAPRASWAVLLTAWLFMEIAVTAVALTSSARKPITDREKQIPVGGAAPISGALLERLFIVPRFRWDAQYHFVAITTKGYLANSPTLAFYPLYPLSARALHLAGLSPHLSLLLLSTLGSLAFLCMFHRLAGLDRDVRDSLWAAVLLLLFPISLILFLPYMESLLLFFSAAALYFARRRRWWLAGAAAMLAALTKQPGVLLVIPLAVELWGNAAGEKVGRRNLGNWLALALAPMAVVAWTVLRAILFEGGFDPSRSLQDQFLGLLVSSSANEMVETRPFAWPWQVILEAIEGAIQTPAARWTVVVNLGGYLIMLLLVIGTWRHLRGSYRLYAVVLIALSLLDFSVNRTYIPVPSLFRHAYLAFPIFVGVPLFIRSGRLRVGFAAVSLVIFLILTYAFVMNGWII